jgi:hypothetical protein
MRLRTLAFTLALLLAPAAVHAQAAGCAAITVSAPGTTQPRNAKVPAFSVSGVVNLDLAVLFKPGSVNRFEAGAHVAEFRVYSPTGALYQSMSVPFTSDSKKKGQPQRLDGYLRPIPTQVLGEAVAPTGKHAMVSLPLAVAGSPITLNSMFGEWRVEALIDGDALTCATPAVFRLEP